MRLRKSQRRGLILGFHRVTTLRNDPYRLAVPPELFREQLRYLNATCEMVPLSELARPGSARRVALTFDDGYLDNVVESLPILKETESPATFFVTSAKLGATREFWWDELEQLVFGLPALQSSVHIGGSQGGTSLEVKLDLTTSAAQLHTLMHIHSLLKPLPISVIEAAIDELADRFHFQATYRRSHALMTAEDVRAAADDPLVEIGGHSETHPVLTLLSEERAREEVAGSRLRLQTVSGCQVTSFCYPYGAHDPRVARLVREGGYLRGCASDPGFVTKHAEPFRLPRHLVFDDEMDVFVAQIERYFSEERGPRSPSRL